MFVEIYILCSGPLEFNKSTSRSKCDWYLTWPSVVEIIHMTEDHDVYTEPKILTGTLPSLNLDTFIVVKRGYCQN